MLTHEDADLWVFGYGSLMWRPGFAFVEKRLATARGYHRALCIYSHVHRGTPEHPGLVLGLDRGGACRGLAFRVDAALRAATLGYLRARELVTSVYLERIIPLALDDKRRIEAVAYVVDRAHPQYAGKLDREACLRLIAQGAGVSGANPDYVRSTHRHLLELGVKDPDLAWYCEHLPIRSDQDVA